MKKLIFLLLLSASMYSQKQVFNVQQYCIDELPFKKGQCDVSGNEYSFVFMDQAKKEVLFFFTDMKLKYNIVSSVVSASNPDIKVYTLQDEKGQVELRVNKKQTKMEFIYPNNHIYLTVGKTTKLEK